MSSTWLFRDTRFESHHIHYLRERKRREDGDDETRLKMRMKKDDITKQDERENCLLQTFLQNQVTRIPSSSLVKAQGLQH